MGGTLHGRVTFDARSFLVDGRRVWLHGGEVHYFRLAPGDWEGALRRARAAGLNTIATSVAWNWHEPTEGSISLSGDRDLARYLDLVHSLGMYAVVRPGPYIGGGWEGGGIPGWLHAAGPLATRDDDPRYMAAVSRWFARLLPLIARRQVSRGGPVILVQNEQDYRGGWNASTRRYIRKLSGLLRVAGIEVPIIAANASRGKDDTVLVNGSADPADQILEPGLLVTCTGGPGVGPLRDLRRRQPDAPVVMTEYRAGRRKPAARGARSVLELTSIGCQVIRSAFDAGTSFGFWGAGAPTPDQDNAPVRAGGLLTRQYYRLKTVNHFVTQFAGELAASEETPDRLGFGFPATTWVVVRACPAGHLLFVTDAGTRPTTWLDHRTHGRLEVGMPASRAVVLPLGLEVLPGLRIDRANVGLLGRDLRAGIVVLWGAAGSEAAVTVNGRTTRTLLPADSVVEIRAGRHRIVVAPERLAERAWFLPGRVVFGPELADERERGRVACRCGEAVAAVQVVTARTVQTVTPPEPAPLPLPPALGPWRRTDCPETDGAGEGWLELPQGPRSHGELGHFLGYAWYRASFEAETDGMLPLYVPRAASRVVVFVRGAYCGVTGELARAGRWGHRHPADAFSHETVQVPVRRGANTIVFLSDNLGSDDGLPGSAGLRGGAYLGGERRPLAGGVPREAIRPFGPQPVGDETFWALYSKSYRTREPLAGVELDLAVPADSDAWIALPNALSRVAVSVDGVHAGAAGVPEAAGARAAGTSRCPFAFLKLPSGVAGRRVTIRIQGRQPIRPADLAAAYALLLPRRSRLGAWAWKPGAEPPSVDGSGAAAGGPTPGARRVSRPAWFASAFPAPRADLPLFLSTRGLRKGQVYLNGRNVGRFWRIGDCPTGGGAQSRCYLPGGWLQEQNRLVIFEEYGRTPLGVALSWGGAAARADIELDSVS